MKTCPKCGTVKPLLEFNKNKRAKDGKDTYCRTCRKSYSRLHRHGISQAEYDILYDAQDGLCYLCGETCKQYGTLSVDRCNIVGIRKLLCMHCINLLHRFRSDPLLIHQAIEYLNYFKDCRLDYLQLVHYENWEEPDVKTTTYIVRNDIKYKWCPRCCSYKSADECFYSRKTEKSQKTYRSWCIACEREFRLEYRYGINTATREYWQMMQGHTCWICNKRCALDTDHSHEGEQRNRGLLCRPCNQGLGFARDDIELTQSAAEYLESYIVPFLALYLPISDDMIEEAIAA